MYSVVLIVHSYARYLVLVLLAVVLMRSLLGATRASTWTNADQRWSGALVQVWDVNFLLGLLLYIFLSPITQFGLRNFGDAMRDNQLREFTLEHPLIMLVATALVHVGAVRSRKAPDDRGKHLRLLIFLAVATVLVIVAIPWVGRPLLRGSIGPVQL